MYVKFITSFYVSGNKTIRFLVTVLAIVAVLTIDLTMDEHIVLLILPLTINMIREALSDDEDEVEDTIIEKIENFVEITIPNFNDKQFKEHFRLHPTTFELLLHHLHNATDVLHDIRKGQPKLAIEKQILMTLGCLANVESFRSVVDRFGISKSACWRILYRTAHRLPNCNRKYNIISFPTGPEAERVMAEFEEISGFPRVLGAVDGCHIRIEKPKEFPNSYINRKGFPSLISQGICERRKLFTDVYPGSLHDARVFQKSDIYERMRNNEIEFPNDSHLLGDLAYSLSTKLLVGFKNRGQVNNAQRLFNKKLSQTRVVIENAFGLLKCRFRRLKMLETRRLDLACLLIMSACILHNVCINNRDYFEGLVEDADLVGGNEIDDDIARAEAVLKRNGIVNYLYHLQQQQEF